MSRLLADHLRWMSQGTDAFLGALAGLTDDELDGPSHLPGWSRRYVLAHVANNAIGLLNLVSWARSGIETPMYASWAERERGIAEDALLPAAELRGRAAASSSDLSRAMDTLQADQWRSQVRTMQGPMIEASEIPWMRSREVFLHAVDLDAGFRLESAPADFLSALVADVAGRRSAEANGPALILRAEGHEGAGSWNVVGHGDAVAVRGDLAGLAAYLTGRDGASAVMERGAPDLSAWL